jgi:hypothetical protein
MFCLQYKQDTSGHLATQKGHFLSSCDTNRTLPVILRHKQDTSGHPATQTRHFRSSCNTNKTLPVIMQHKQDTSCHPATQTRHFRSSCNTNKTLPVILQHKQDTSGVSYSCGPFKNHAARSTAAGVSTVASHKANTSDDTGTQAVLACPSCKRTAYDRN